MEEDEEVIGIVIQCTDECQHLPHSHSFLAEKKKAKLAVPDHGSKMKNEEKE